MQYSAFVRTNGMALLLSSADCHKVSKHGAPYLKLLWEVKCNGVVLLSCFEVSAGLHKRDDWSGHADLCIVNIVARDVFEQFLQEQMSVNTRPSPAWYAQPPNKCEDSKAYREGFGDCYLEVGPFNGGSYKLGCRTRKAFSPCPTVHETSTVAWKLKAIRPTLTRRT